MDSRQLAALILFLVLVTGCVVGWRFVGARQQQPGRWFDRFK